MTRFLLISAVVVAFATAALPQGANAGSRPPVAFLEPGTVRLDVQPPGGRPIHLYFLIEKPDANCNLETLFDNPVLWGSNASNAPPQNFISRIAMGYADARDLEDEDKEKGNINSYNPSAYLNLTNISNISWEASNSGFTVIIRGGREQTSYMSRIDFDQNNRFTNREVTGVGLPVVGYETAFYNQNLDNLQTLTDSKNGTDVHAPGTIWWNWQYSRKSISGNVFELWGDGTAEFHETLPNGDIYEVTIVMETFNKNCMTQSIFASANLWGRYRYDKQVRRAENYIRRFSVRYNGREVPVPFSAYSDIAQIYAIIFDADSDGFTLNMDVGQTSSSAFATFEFNQSGFLTRRLATAHYPEDYGEDSKYFPPE